MAGHGLIVLFLLALPFFQVINGRDYEPCHSPSPSAKCGKSSSALSVAPVDH